MSVPFQTNGVVKVWVFQPVDVVYVEGPKTVVYVAFGKYVAVIAVAVVPPILMVKLPMDAGSAAATLKATDVMVPGGMPNADNSDAKTRYCTRPSIYHVLYGVICELVPVLVRVPVPNV